MTPRSVRDLIARLRDEGRCMPLQFVVLIPAVVVMVMPDLSFGVAGYAGPVLGAQVVFRDLIPGRLDMLAFAVMTGSTVICATLAVGLALRQFSREQDLFRV